MPSVLALKAHVRMLSVVLALIAPTVQSSESGCQAASPFGLVAGYAPSSNVSAMIDVDVRTMDTALGATTPDYTNILAIYEAGGLPALSNTTKALMYDCAAGCPLKHYQMYYDYYGDFDYADKWARAAIGGAKTGFTNGLYDVDFDTYNSGVTRRTAASKGASFLTTWIYSIGMFEEAVNLCDTTANAAALGFWDKGVAYYTGSLEGTDGNSKTGTFGELTYAYADRMCKEFKTCGATGGQTSGGSRVNSEVLSLFFDGARFLKAGQCSPLRALTYKIVQLMTVPLVQATLRSAYQLGFTTADKTAETAPEGATYAAALLPLLHYCDSSSGRTAAPIVAENLVLGAGTTNFVRVKNAIEQSYQCLGITCVEVGGLWDTNLAPPAYLASGEPCVDSQQSQTYVEVYPPIAGFSPGSSVNEHNEVDLDIRDMIAETDLSKAKLWYTSGGNSQKSGGRTRTVRGFSTAAKKKMYGGCLKKPASAENPDLSNIEFDPAYTGVQCYKHPKMFFDYYGDYSYADTFTTAAFDGANTNFTNGNADFSKVTDESIRKAAAIVGSAHLNTWMYVVREYEDAIDDCVSCTDTSRGCNEFSADSSINAWDEGVAFSVGSLEGTEGNSREGNYGMLLYALAERRCIDFKTCSLFGGKLTGGSQVNHELLTVLSQGSMRLNRGECATVRPIVDTVVQLMTVPLIQSTLLYAHKRENANVAEDIGYGTAFAATLLPMLASCDKLSGGTTADTLFENMHLEATSTSFKAVKKALEDNYDCLSVSCPSVGGLWNTAAGTYFSGANPCGGVAICLAGQTGSECQTCGPGYYYSSENVLCVPCPADSFKSETSEADKCSACPIYSTTLNLKSRISATACQCASGFVGTIKSTEGVCSRCAHFKLVEEQLVNGTYGTACPGGEEMTVPFGWYKAADSIELYECRDQDQCMQSSGVTFEEVSRCTEGSVGPLCGSCDSTHIIDKSGHCNECTSSNWGVSIGQMLGVITIFAILVLFEAWSAFSEMKANTYNWRWGAKQATGGHTSTAPAPADKEDEGMPDAPKGLGNRRQSAGGTEHTGFKAIEGNSPSGRRSSAGGTKANGSRRASMSEQMADIVGQKKTRLIDSDDLNVAMIAGGRWNLKLVWMEMRTTINVAHYSPVMRIILGYTQLIGLLSLIGEGALARSAAGRLMQSLDFLRFVSFGFFLEMFSLIDCSVSQEMLGKTIATMVVPLVLALFVGLFCLLWKVFVPNVGQGEYVRAMSFGGIVIYSAVIQKLVSNYASVSVDGTNYARHDTSVDYDSSGHTSLMIASIFYAVTYGLIGPGILLLMYYRGMKARKGAMKSYYFGFLVKGYDKDFFWWEYTVLSRRFICCLVVSVSTSDPFLTSSIIGIIFALSIVAHMLCTPYATSFLNVIELVNLVCVLLSASANMVAFGTEHEEVIEYAAAIYVFAQLFFMISILVVTVVLLTAIKGRNQFTAIGLTSLPAMFAKGTAMFS